MTAVVAAAVVAAVTMAAKTADVLFAVAVFRYPLATVLLAAQDFVFLARN